MSNVLFFLQSPKEQPLSINFQIISALASKSKYYFARLTIEGQRIKPCYLQDLDESSPLYEEIIAVDGNLEEFFAFDNTYVKKERISVVFQARQMYITC